MNSDDPKPLAHSTPPAPKVSVLAVLSLIFGVLGCTGVGALAGLAFGVLALVRISNSKGLLRGNALAISGMIVSLVSLILLPVLVGMLLPALAQAKAKAQIVQSANHARQIGLAALIYAADHDQKLPLAANWNDALRRELSGDTAATLRRPGAGEDSECGYGYNAAVAGLPQNKVDPRTVLFFELETPQDNAAGGLELLRQPKRPRDRVIVALADGSVRQLKAEELSALRWQP